MIDNNAIHHTAMDVDPRTLVLKAQVRRDPAADAQLVESIRLRGVLQPIVVTEENDDEFVVLAGHRRTLAAIEAGLATVPITVVGIRTEADRIADQLAENDQRAALAVSDRVAAYDQMALIGLTAERIAEETATPLPEVQAALKIATSTAVADVMDGYGLTLDQLAALAEFEDDPKVVEDLVDAAQSGRFAHALQRHQDKRRHERLIAEKRSELEAAGLTVIERPDNYLSDGAPSRPLHYLGIENEDHIDCPGRCFAVQAGWDWSEDDNRYLPTVGATTEYCDGWKQHHPEKVTASSASGKSEDPEERRRVRENNAAWRSATTVRRAWITDLLAGATPPKGAALFVANTLHLRASALGDYGASQLHDDLGLPKGSYPVKPLPASTTEKRAQMIVLGYAIAAHEGNQAFAQAGWRNPEKRYAVYLGYLQEIGYGLSEIETACLKTSRKAKG